ncbi:hypothetical protein DPMN_000519 [Dreissena polymorpha]|uniref:Uncharacterized protein n=1 Tax=Dreissena polymorpha TaxID=45954 RepID=A0A9D4MJQ9_DREPO|nr:hypothetical protein DPMN_000519 [Dreissena polymorpha]
MPGDVTVRSNGADRMFGDVTGRSSEVNRMSGDLTVHRNRTGVRRCYGADQRRRSGSWAPWRKHLT